MEDLFNMSASLAQCGLENKVTPMEKYLKLFKFFVGVRLNGDYKFQYFSKLQSRLEY